MKFLPKKEDNSVPPILLKWPIASERGKDPIITG